MVWSGLVWCYIYKVLAATYHSHSRSSHSLPPRPRLDLSRLPILSSFHLNSFVSSSPLLLPNFSHFTIYCHPSTLCRSLYLLAFFFVLEQTRYVSSSSASLLYQITTRQNPPPFRLKPHTALGSPYAKPIFETNVRAPCIHDPQSI